MSEHAAITETPEPPAPPSFDPDAKLIAHLEGNALTLRAYRRKAEELRREAHEEDTENG
jgi:hypothetical protein